MKDLQGLMLQLNDLSRNLKALNDLLQIGTVHPEAVVNALTEFLLSPPALHFQPRALAAEGLGILGGERAIEALIAALDFNDVSQADPSVRLSEEVVRDAAAEQLGKIGDRRAIEPLLLALERNHPIEAALALSRFKERRALPQMVAMLEDPFHRDRVAEATLVFGETAIPALAEALRVPRYIFEDQEAKISVERRAAAAELLGELGSLTALPALKRARFDHEAPVREAVARAIDLLRQYAQ